MLFRVERGLHVLRQEAGAVSYQFAPYLHMVEMPMTDAERTVRWFIVGHPWAHYWRRMREVSVARRVFDQRAPRRKRRG
jgi:hypothetical protein